ncbi:MAG: hypothetical protein EA389_08525 [Ilumatobacter sp.]|nr:MAG: hypothetical protein EA389_08525 [Ilumatobacter sp.]
MQALRDLRRARRARRLGDLEWFDIAYRVYLAALFGGGAVIVVSDLVGDAEISTARSAELFEAAPGVLGLLVVAVLALGLRSGADGGPVAVEAGDVRHLLLAPVSRRRVLARPLAQRARSLVFAGAVVAAIAGQLAAQRLPGSPARWSGGAALAGAALAIVFVAFAVLAHTLRVRRSMATGFGAALVLSQIVAVRTDTAGIGDPLGHVAVLGWRRDPRGGPLLDPVDPVMIAVGLLVPIALLGTAFALIHRLRIEALVRRGALVSQLRFAVTVQDLRTVIVLRRQLRSESPRTRPWIRIGRSSGANRPPMSGGGDISWRALLAAGSRRGLHGLARTPAARALRMLTLAAFAGLTAHIVLEGTTPMLVVVGFLAFLIGLDALEPLSQEIDHPPITDVRPVERGVLHLALLIVPVVTVAIAALVAAAVVTAAAPERAGAAFAVAVPLALVGLAGATVAVIRDSSSVGGDGPAMVPPEFAGFGTAMRTVVPVAVSMLAAVALLGLRAEPTAESVVRSIIGAGLVLGAVGWWIRRRDQWGRAWREATTVTTSQARPAVGAPSEGGST